MDFIHPTNTINYNTGQSGFLLENPGEDITLKVLVWPKLGQYTLILKPQVKKNQEESTLTPRGGRWIS